MPAKQLLPLKLMEKPRKLNAKLTAYTKNGGNHLNFKIIQKPLGNLPGFFVLYSTPIYKFLKTLKVFLRAILNLFKRPKSN